MVFVTPGGTALKVGREFAAERASKGHGEIPIVPDLDAAWRVLEIETPMFF
jgi:hypothetical protein